MNKVFIIVFFLGLNGSVFSQSTFTDLRDNELYSTIQINELLWFQENLRFVTDSSRLYDDSERSKVCGQFYALTDAFSVCPNDWRLPTESEVKNLLKLEKKNIVSLVDTLKVDNCGRIDYDKASKQGVQNTFWIQVELEGTYATHWHFFKDDIHMHHHNVAKKMFPVRCVKLIEEH